MNLDDLLRDTLSDDRWALPVPADTLPAVRRKRTQRRALATIATATGAAAAVVALALTVGGSGGTEPIVRPTLNFTTPLRMSMSRAHWQREPPPLHGLIATASS